MNTITTLTAQQHTEIRQLFAAGTRIGTIARTYDATVGTIDRILRDHPYGRKNEPKLTPADRAEAVALWTADTSIAVIARKFQVSTSCIDKVLRTDGGKTSRTP